MFPHFCGSTACLLSLQLTANDVPEHMFVVERRGPGIVVHGRWPPMPIVEWWDVWYRQIPGAAQLVDRMSRGVQRGLQELSNAGQDSPAPERQRSTPLESSPAVTTAPQPSPVGESFEEFYKSVWDPNSESDSSKLPSDTVQDVKALATELAAASKDGDEEKAIRAESAHASALEVCTVAPVKCSSTARLNRLNHGFTIFSFLQSLDQALQRRLAVEDTRKQLGQRFGWAANTPLRWVIVDGPDGKPRLAVGTPGKATKGDPPAQKGQVVKEEKVESAGPGVQEHQESGEDSPAAPVRQEEIEEVGRAPKDEEMPACKQEDNEEAAPEVGAPVPHVTDEPLPND